MKEKGWNHALYFRCYRKHDCFRERCHLCIRGIIRILSRRRESHVIRETRHDYQKTADYQKTNRKGAKQWQSDRVTERSSDRVNSVHYNSRKRLRHFPSKRDILKQVGVCRLPNSDSILVTQTDWPTNIEMLELEFTACNTCQFWT